MAYKPKRSDNLIVFEERQIDSIQATLAANFSSAVMLGAAFTDLYSQSSNTCTVTLNEPFLDGISWETLNDVDLGAYLGNQLAINGVLLPKCQPGQSPDVDKCANYSQLEGSRNRSRYDDAALLIITLWYTLEGINQTNSIDFYYKVVGTNIKHGEGLEPQVILNGRGAYDVILQENVNPKFFEKDQTVIDELNNKVLNIEGYVAEDICSTPADERTVERTYRINGLTSRELINKFVSSGEGGQVMSLPTKEFANKVQICSKADSVCYASRVFYLGKGLYEKYSIRSNIPTSPAERNVSKATETIELPGEPKIGEKVEFTSNSITPIQTARALNEVTDAGAFGAFEKQFENRSDYLTGDVANGWKAAAAGKKVTIEKIEKKSLFGNAKSGKSYLGGVVESVGNNGTRVVIKTNFYVHLCTEDAKCYRTSVYEEYKNLKSSSAKEKESLSPNAPIGEIETTPQKHTLFRYFGKAAGGDIFTFDPTTLKGILNTSKAAKEVADIAPTNNSSDGLFVGKVGSTGRSTGPHVHIQESTARTLSEQELYNLSSKYVRVNGTRLTDFSKNAGFGDNRGHNGIDFNAPNGGDITIEGTIVSAGAGVGGGNCGNGVAFTTPEGTELLICHLQDSSIPKDIRTDATGTFSNSGLAHTSGPGTADAIKDGIRLETEFKGVPKALEILPGRTILSFISDYDSWIVANKNPNIDPGVWIPKNYINWQVNQTQFNWDSGDLRVKINGMRPFASRTSRYALDAVPSFESYRAEKGYTDYYDYIRSSGDLCYTTNYGKNSCTECKKPSTPPSTGGAPGPDSVVGGYVKGRCQYTGSRFNKNTVNSLLNAAQEGGLKIDNKFGLAGILGNAGWESVGFNPKASGPSKEVGLFQWNPDVGRQQQLYAYSENLGLDPLTVEAQVKFFVEDVTKRYPSVVSSMNSAKSVEDAVKKFEEIYEKADPAYVNYAGRNEIGNHIYDNLTCS